MSDSAKSKFPFTVRELTDIKRTQSSQNRADFRKLLTVLPQDILLEHSVWRKEVRLATLERAKTGKRQSVVLSEFAHFSNTLPYRTSQLIALLTHPACGWSVVAQTDNDGDGKFRIRVILTIY